MVVHADDWEGFTSRAVWRRVHHGSFAWPFGCQGGAEVYESEVFREVDGVPEAKCAANYCARTTLTGA